MKRILLTFIILFVFCNAMFAKIILPSVFTDNMVLQQNSNVAIWGWADPGETIRIAASWSKDTIKVRADNAARWSTTIKTTAAGGPYTLQLLGSSKVQLSNVMLGEVWLCSGQSNMEMSVNWGLINGEEEAAKATNPNIRIFHVQKLGADYPQQNCMASWTVCSPETMRATSAVGYFFARELQQKLNVPVGIIVSAWGGTPAEVWIEKNRVLNDPVLNKGRVTNQYEWWPSNPGVLYNSMIAPVIPYGIAGTIWYQGEANIENYQIYSALLKTLVENWRSDFKKDFPFYLVQIAPYTYGPTSNAAYLREQQEIASMTIPNSGMAVVSDLVDNVKDIHPKNKMDVGKRLAAFALAETYKQNVGEYKSPFYESMKVEKDKVRLSFKNASAGFKTTNKSPQKFMIAGEDHKFVPATAKIAGSEIIVSSKEVKAPVAVRFCFDDASMPDVFSNNGLPLAPFRTDKW
ncbi:MAG: sialate O-acetylesterase [Candidatus Saccharibacteria bacterium]